MTEQLLKIDGQRFEVMLIKISRSASILDKYAKRTINGDLQREILSGLPNRNQYSEQCFADL